MYPNKSRLNRHREREGSGLGLAGEVGLEERLGTGDREVGWGGEGPGMFIILGARCN